MTQTLLEPGSAKRLRIRELTNMAKPTVLTDRLDDCIWFPLATRPFLTPFRKLVLNYIYRVVLELANNTLESARVSLCSVPEEEDSLHLALTLSVRSDWQLIQELRQEIFSRVSDWAKEWTEEEQQDYGRWIYVSLLPTQL